MECERCIVVAEVNKPENVSRKKENRVREEFNKTNKKAIDLGKIEWKEPTILLTEEIPKATAIIRTRDMCHGCFNVLTRDNKKLNNQGLDITRVFGVEYPKTWQEEKEDKEWKKLKTSARPPKPEREPKIRWAE